MGLLFVDGECLENSESVGFQCKPPSLSELELSVNEARVPITPNPGADFRTQVLTLVERLVLAAEENEPLSSAHLPLPVLVITAWSHRCFKYGSTGSI